MDEVSLADMLVFVLSFYNDCLTCGSGTDHQLLELVYEVRRVCDTVKVQM